ncbi:MAG: PIN domain-containing protein [Nanoarchaeota archaeon]|nr:PIN domain-containing protein [Nanoarchaeota archaeon]
MRYYIDTSIWIDLYEDRKGFNGEPLGDYALKLLSFINSGTGKLVITDFLIRELSHNYSLEEINGMFNPFCYDKIFVSENQRKEAERIAKERDVPKGDALHAIIARDNNLLLVSRDNHFKQLRDIWPHHKPEEII